MLQLAFAWVLFYVLHSLLAWTGVKRWAADHVGLTRWYRLVYSTLSVVLLVWVWSCYRRVDTTLVWPVTMAARVAGYMLILAGGSLAALAVLRFGGAAFLGLQAEVNGALVRNGLHGRMRHPIYTGTLLVMAGWLLLVPTPATVVSIAITCIYLPVGIHLEERKLIAQFGEEYLRYKAEVPVLWPRWSQGKGVA
jgi:protein-S-isoprenylcysteine O-methyltransferase Ste14